SDCCLHWGGFDQLVGPFLGGVGNSEDREGRPLAIRMRHTTSIACHGGKIIHIDGESYRIKEARETAEKKTLRRKAKKSS
ncbi:MAG: hypothetical protein ACYDEV_02025, partial [Acidiferrobacter sp.]